MELAEIEWKHKTDLQAEYKRDASPAIGAVPLRYLVSRRCRRKRLAAKAKDAGVTRVVFDRAGYKYHGRVKGVADGAREGGLEF